MKPIIEIFNAETGEAERREMNDAEFAQFQLDQKNDADLKAKAEADKAEAEAKRQVLLNRLGITEEEAKLLLA